MYVMAIIVVEIFRIRILKNALDYFLFRFLPSDPEMEIFKAKHQEIGTTLTIK